MTQTTSTTIFSRFHRMHSQAVYEQNYPRWLPYWDERAVLWLKWLNHGKVGVGALARELAERSVVDETEYERVHGRTENIRRWSASFFEVIPGRPGRKP